MDMQRKRAVYERYLTAWSPVSDEQRIQILAETVTSDIAYLDANAKCGDREALAKNLAGFQLRRAGCRFTVENFLQYYDLALVNWAMIDPGGKVLVKGYDSTRFAASGMISSITGFSDVPSQRVES